MPKLDIEQLKPYILDYARRLPKDSHGRTICPFCSSGATKGDGKKHDSAFSIDRARNKFKCFSCHANGDLFDLIGQCENLPTMGKQLARANELYGNSGDFLQPAKQEPQRKEPTDYTPFFQEASKHLQETEYHRGISIDTLQRFNVGFVAEWRPPTRPNATPSPRLIIPTSQYSYLARDTRPTAALTDNQRTFQKQKIGAVHLFNSDILSSCSEPIFIVEGELDALSIIDVGGNAIGLGGTSGTRQLVKKLQQLKSQNRSILPKLLLALDNDEAGRQADKELAQELATLGIPSLSVKLYDTFKDANARLMSDKDGLATAVQAALIEANTKQAKEDIATMTTKTAAAESATNKEKSLLDTAYFTLLDKAELLDVDTIKAISKLKDEQREQVLSQARDRAKALKCVRDFDRAYKKIREAAAKTLIAENAQNTYTIEVDGTSITLDTGDWHIDDTGVWRWVQKGDKVNRVQAAANPILPTEVYENYEDRLARVRIHYKLNKKWRNVIADIPTIASATKIIMLSAYRVPVGTANALQLSSYLQEIVNLNEDRFAGRKSSSHLGWIHDSFLPYASDYALDTATSQRAIIDSISQQGDLQTWLDSVESWRQNIAVRLAIDTSFASVLLEKVGALPFVFHLWGTTGAGKTVTLMVCASVWGDPRRGKLVKSLDNTINALMTAAYTLHDIPFIGDELQTVRSRNGYDNLIMQATEGINRGRLDSNSDTKKTMSWNNAFLFSGEEPCTTPNSGGGVWNRCIEVECINDLFDDMPKVARIVQANYGHAGKVFIEELLEMDMSKIIDQFDQYRDHIQNSETFKTTAKQAAAMAAIMTADNLLHTIFWPNEQPLKDKDIKPYLKSAVEVDTAKRAYDYAYGILSEYQNNFNLKIKPNGEPIERGVHWGWIDTDKDGTKWFLVNKIVLERELSKGGFVFKAIKKKWYERGYLQLNSQGRYIHQTTQNGEKGNFIKIKAEPNEDE